MNKMKILDLGAGALPLKANPEDEIITIDHDSRCSPTVLHDLCQFPYPFKDNEFDLIYASHILEHLKDLVKVMEELWRITKPNGRIIIKSPHFSSVHAWLSPDHKRVFSINSFDLFEKSDYWKSGGEHFGDCEYKVIKKELRYCRLPMVSPNPLKTFFAKLLNFLANKNPYLCERLWCYLVGGFSEIYLELEVIK